jgi:hypothetical protein
MIDFNHLLDGIYYYHNCLLCNSAMSIQNEGINYDCTYANSRTGYNLIFTLDKIDKLIINPHTEEVKIETYKYNDPTTDNYYDGSVIKNHLSYMSDNYDYIDCFQLSINCPKCKNFSYTIDLIVDLYQKKISRMRLNQLTVCMEEKIGSYFIVNDFYDNKTSLLFSGGGIEKTLLHTSLVEMDYINPKNTFSRLKKLIVFS